MKIYLVGGAVRDTLLDIEVKERDWVVVGATPEVVFELGYKQVGSDFLSVLAKAYSSLVSG